MACPVCGDIGSGDRSVGIMEDDGLCRVCACAGWEEADCGCLTTPSGDLQLCERHQEEADARQADENAQAAEDAYWHRRIDEALGK